MAVTKIGGIQLSVEKSALSGAANDSIFHDEGGGLFLPVQFDF